MRSLGTPGKATFPQISPAAALVGATAVLTLVTIAVGAMLVLGDRDIGAPLPPTLFRWRPHLGELAPLAALMLAAAVACARPLLAERVPPVAFVGATLALALVLRLGLNAARAGPVDWWIFFDPRLGEGTVEYLAALPALEAGLRVFLDRFADIATGLPVHAAGHPPGLLVLVGLFGIETAPALAALIIAVGLGAVPGVYLLGRELLGTEELARVATLLYVFAPNALLYGASAADALFATLATLAALALVQRRALVRLTAGPAALALATFFSYANLAVAAWAAIVVGLGQGWRRAACLVAASAAGLVAFYLTLHALTGFDALGAVAATEDVYRVGIARLRPYWYFVAGAPVAWMLALGPPIAVLWLRAAAHRSAPALALAAVVVASALGGFTKAETERIWLFLVPLACLAAAPALPRRGLVPVLALLAAQAFLMQVLLGTVW